MNTFTEIAMHELGPQLIREIIFTKTIIFLAFLGYISLLIYCTI